MRAEATRGTVVIVGSGHAGVQVAFGLRRNGWAGPVLLFDEERYVPYQRPPLSKDMLSPSGAVAPLLLRKEQMYLQKDITRMAGARIVSIDRPARTVTASDGRTFLFDRLVLCTGARARRLDIPGHDLRGVQYLRTHGEAEELKHALAPDRHVVVVGAGYIGMEVAAAATKHGCDVTVVELTGRVLSRVTSKLVSEYFQRLHRDHGVRFVFGTAVVSIDGSQSVVAVRTSDGELRPADTVVIGVGITPNDELAAEAGLDCADGIVVDEAGRTSDPKIHAAGDVTRLRSRNEAGLRLECIQNATSQADRVVADLVGEQPLRADVPWFWTDQHGVRLQTAGLRYLEDEVLVRGSVDGGSFSVLYLRDGILSAIDTVDAMHDFIPAKKLIAARQPIDTRRAADPSIKLPAAAIKFAEARR